MNIILNFNDDINLLLIDFQFPLFCLLFTATHRKFNYYMFINNATTTKQMERKLKFFYISSFIATAFYNVFFLSIQGR